MRGNRNAAMPTVTDIGSLIVRSEDSHGNRPRVAGIGVTVRGIIGWYKQGLTPGRNHHRGFTLITGAGLCRSDLLPR